MKLLVKQRHERFHQSGSAHVPVSCRFAARGSLSWHFGSMAVIAGCDPAAVRPAGAKADVRMTAIRGARRKWQTASWPPLLLRGILV
jgi:hypothetical protein